MAVNLFADGFAQDRRHFIKGVGFVSTSLLVAVTLGGCDKILEQIRNRPIRRRLRTGFPEVDQAITVYKDAVTQMRALPASNPRSWAAQSAIHGTVAGGFNLCQHRTLHFFSWHRASLLYFEQICRELTGQKDWALPYWNWNLDHDMHPEFTAPGSVLNHPRNSTGIGNDPAFSDGILGPIMGDPDFANFSDQIEGSPHDNTHVIIGQDMVTGGSPRDPVFWVHHCMADYCWAKWNIELGNDSPSDSAWQNTSWNHFTKGDGTPAGDVKAIATVLMPLLSYRYESSNIGGIDASPSMGASKAAAQAAESSEADFKKLQDRLQRGANVRTETIERIELTRGARMRLGEPLTLRVAQPVSALKERLAVRVDGERSFIRIKHADLPEVSDFLVRVFLNLPKANRATSVDDPHFAGTFSFFGTAGMHGGDHADHADKKGKTDFLVNITATIERLAKGGMLDSNTPLSVQLVAVPASARGLSKPDSALTVTSVELIRARVLIDAQAAPS